MESLKKGLDIRVRRCRHPRAWFWGERWEARIWPGHSFSYYGFTRRGAIRAARKTIEKAREEFLRP